MDAAGSNRSWPSAASDAEHVSVYRERPSGSGAVVWTRTETTPGEVRVLPDGCIDLIWTSSGTLFVASPDRQAQMHVARPGRVLTGLRFAPGEASAVLGVPAQAVADIRPSLDELWRPSEVRRLVERLAGSPSPGRTLEDVVAERLGGRTRRRLEAEVVRLLRNGISVHQVADAVGLSERQLRRRSLDSFGYGPKRLARILRLQRALELARTGFAQADVALTAGYADQAHLAHDVRALTGASIREIIR